MLALATYALQVVRGRLRAERWPRVLCLTALGLWAASEFAGGRTGAYDPRWVWLTIVGFTLLFLGVGLKLYRWMERRRTVTTPLRSPLS